MHDSSKNIYIGEDLSTVNIFLALYLSVIQGDY